ncbi:MAG: hypothetical protein JXR76_24270 [Deltaproteobacteria bacterium]|nr:hypothetical protein [Deltaproteobacteria bacterium]
MRNFLVIGLLTCVLLFAASGCKEDIEDADIPQFNQPQAVALVCFDRGTNSPLPLKSCRNSERTNAEIFAFVTQAEYGEVAVVNLEDYQIVDQEKRIPFNSFVPVGGRPVDIAASADGSRVYTANYGTSDISIVDVTTSVAGGRLLPAESVYVEFPPSKIIIASDVGNQFASGDSTQDEFAFVSQPAAGRVAVVQLKDRVETDANGLTFTIPKGVLGWIRLDGGTLKDNVVDERPDGIAPSSMVASANMASLFVGGRLGRDDQSGSYIAEIQREIFIDRALDSFRTFGEARPLDPADIVIRLMDLQEYTVRDMSIEPELERWMYISENERGGVVVLDLRSGELVEVNSWDFTRDQPYSIEMPYGKAKKVKMVRFSESVAEDEKPGYLDFNGTFALVSTTSGLVYVIDVSVDDEMKDLISKEYSNDGSGVAYSFYPHSLRTKADWFSDDDEAELLFPELTDTPRLYGDGEILDYDDPFVTLLEPDTDTVVDTNDTAVDTAAGDTNTATQTADTTDTESNTGADTVSDTIMDTGSDAATDSGSGTGSDVDTNDASSANADETTAVENPCSQDPSGFRIVESEDGHNVYFRCDQRLSSNEQWQLNYQGEVGISGKAIWEKDATLAMTGSIVLRDVDKDFCRAGLLGPDVDGNLWGVTPPDVEHAELYQRFTGYPGDIIEITSEPKPRLKATNCKRFENEDLRKWYRVSEVIDEERIRIEVIPGKKYAPLPTQNCFSEVFTYKVRANASWVLTGQSSGRLSEGSMQNGKCVPWRDGNSHPWKSARVFEDADFENVYLKFRLGKMENLGGEKTKNDFDTLSLQFATDNSFFPMTIGVGSQVTSIEVAPNNDVIFIEQAEQGMLIFDMVDEFEMVEHPIN